MKFQFGSLVALAVFYNSVTAVPVPAPATATEAVVPNISDAALNTAGNLLATLFQALAPSAAFKGASSAIGACYDNGSGGTVCARGEASDNNNISDSALNTAGNLIATFFKAFAPSAAFNGASGAVGACYKNSYGGLVCPRDEASDDGSITDAALNTAGNLIATFFQAFAPSAAFNGASGAVGACYKNSYGGLVCPRDETGAAAIDGISKPNLAL